MDIESLRNNEHRRRFLCILSVLVAQVVYHYNLLFLPTTQPIPYHDAILTGETWMIELQNGHPDRIQTCLGVNHEVFERLVCILVQQGITRSRNGISVEEQLGIFLYTCVTGLSSRHIAERFQHSPGTINRYFKKILKFFASAPFYTSQIRFPTSNSLTPAVIANGPRFRFFHDCIGAVDGMHIRVFTPTEDHQIMRNRKGLLSQNCLFICDLDFFFLYARTGSDGSSLDAKIWHDAHMEDLQIPQGKYLLADAGYGTSDSLLVPYRNTRYHLKEWKNSHASPQNREELFNIRHAALRNVIERIFSVLKRQFRCLQIPLKYDLPTQALLPLALCALHNFIRKYNPDNFFDMENSDGNDDFEEDLDGNPGVLAEGLPDAREQCWANTRRDLIAQEMWDEYRAELREDGIGA